MLKIDKVSCLCLDSHKNRWPELDKDLAQYGLITNKFVAGNGTDESLDYDYINVKKANKQWSHGTGKFAADAYNKYCCHQKIIQSAMSDNVDSVLILEDNIFVIPRFFNVISQITPEIKAIEWDMLYLGYSDEIRTKEDEKAYDDCGYASIGKVTKLFGLHGVVIKKALFQLILSLPPTSPIDIALQFNTGHNNLKSYYVRPKVIGLIDE